MTEAFGFIFIRMLAFVLCWPFLNKISVSFLFKFFLSFGISAILFLALPIQDISFGTEAYLWVGFKELLIGLSLGFLSRIFFSVIEMVSDFIEALFFETQESEDKIWGDFQVIFITVLFLSLNGHYAFVMALFKSYEILPISLNMIHYGNFNWPNFLQNVMEIGMSLSLPFVLCIFLMKLISFFSYKWTPYFKNIASDMTLILGLWIFIFLISLPMFSDFTNTMIQMSLDKMIYWMKVV